MHVARITRIRPWVNKCDCLPSSHACYRRVGGKDVGQAWVVDVLSGCMLRFVCAFCVPCAGCYLMCVCTSDGGSCKRILLDQSKQSNIFEASPKWTF